MPNNASIRIKPAHILAVLLMIGGAVSGPPAQAAEEFEDSYQVADSNNLPTRIPGLGTFSGGISAKQFKGNGIYFSIEGNDGRHAGSRKTSPRPGAKIIDMQDAQHEMDCDNPGDVCVIRP